ncbi:MAG: YgaP-like transmembrane domain [Acidimicrobiia bacterium]
MGFVKFMSSPAGRGARVVAGIVLILIGVIGGGGLFALAVIGLVPLLAGAFDVCLFAPLFRQPLQGSKIRANQR